MATSKEILNFLRENKEYLHKNFHCVEIGVFGSYARGEQTANSDIDILVVFEENAPDLYRSQQQLQKYLQLKLNKKVDIAAKKWIKPVFKKMVLEETLYA